MRERPPRASLVVLVRRRLPTSSSITLFNTRCPTDFKSEPRRHLVIFSVSKRQAENSFRFFECVCGNEHGPNGEKHLRLSTPHMKRTVRRFQPTASTVCGENSKLHGVNSWARRDEIRYGSEGRTTSQDSLRNSVAKLLLRENVCQLGKRSLFSTLPTTRMEKHCFRTKSCWGWMQAHHEKLRPHFKQRHAWLALDRGGTDTGGGVVSRVAQRSSPAVDDRIQHLCAQPQSEEGSNKDGRAGVEPPPAHGETQYTDLILATATANIVESNGPKTLFSAITGTDDGTLAAAQFQCPVSNGNVSIFEARYSLEKDLQDCLQVTSPLENRQCFPLHLAAALLWTHCERAAACVINLVLEIRADVWHTAPAAATALADVPVKAEIRIQSGGRRSAKVSAIMWLIVL